MRHASHDHLTLIAAVRRAVQKWRKRAGWSRETVTQEIVATFDRLDGPLHTGIRFDPDTRDVYERTKVNADRVFRWLDDETKDTNHLPPNMLPFVLAALPVDLRIACVDEFLRPAGLTVRLCEVAREAMDIAKVVQTVIKESGEATCALASLLDGTSPGELETAQRELTESIAVQQDALAQVESALTIREMTK